MQRDVRRDTIKLGQILTIADQIQAFGFARKTGEIFLNNAPPPARINMVEGQIVDAQFGTSSGLEAAIAIINYPDPETQFVVGETSLRNTINMPFTEILCEAARARDEAEALKTQSKTTSHLRQISAMPTLRVTLGTEIKTYAIRPGTTFLGRADDNDIVINDTTISNRHARIESSEAGVRLYDLGSTNGTFVAGEAITERWLGLQDSLQFGGVHCLYIHRGERK